MSRLALVAMVLLSVGACDKKKETTGLPPASKWNEGSAGGGGGGAGADPHAGMDMGGGGADPHAGMDMGGGGAAADPHAGMDMGGGTGGGPDPHGGSGGAAPVDPNARPPDPNHYLRGTITFGPKAKDKVVAGTALFVMVKRPDPATGEGVGMPLVVQKMDADPKGMPFDLNESNSMLPGTPDLTGEVVIMARVDQDGNATSKQPGDVTGTLRVTVPQKDLKLVLDTVLP